MSAHHDHAIRWTAALTASLDAALAMYADDLTYDDRADADHVPDTAMTKAELRPRLEPYSNKDAKNGWGVHTFVVREAFPLVGHNGRDAVVTLWTWTGTGLGTYHGLPVDGKELSTIGITWQELDHAGRITREQTYWNDTPVFQALGVPIQTPHYWEPGFGAA